MRSRILNKLWTILFVPPNALKGKKKRANGGSTADHALGDCDPPDTKNKKIRIANTLPPKEELEVTIHECLHAADWYKDEEWIEPVAADIARLLWRLGWRKPKKDP